MLKKAIQFIINRLTVEQRKNLYFYIERSFSADEQPMLNRYNTLSALKRLKQVGFKPGTILDIGAYKGEWTKEMAPLFPHAKCHLFEPQADKQVVIKQNLNGIDFICHQVLLGNQKQPSVPFYQMESGSSVKEELSAIPREKLEMPMDTLDGFFSDTKLKKPLLIKLDVQGNEAEVLEGATTALLDTELVVMELSFLDFNRDSFLAHHMINLMAGHGFVIFDFGGFMRNGNDQSLIQADVVFIRNNSHLRQSFNDFTKPFTVFASH